MNHEEVIKNIRNNDRRTLARAITLIESTRPQDQAEAELLIQSIMQYQGGAIRIGISGVPGAGKSTFIESFGVELISRNKKVAVLAIDPTSSLSGGSVLGDKTRMQRLIQSPLSFIRPSPSGLNLGGVARKTRETLLLCEAAGYDVIIIETVGVGQSEIDVASMTDLYMLVMLPNAGDELQGIKKGILELADMIVVNKIDTDKSAAMRTMAELKSAMHYARPKGKPSDIPVFPVSALHDEGLGKVADYILNFFEVNRAGIIPEKRNEQNLNWMNDFAKNELISLFENHPDIVSLKSKLEEEVRTGKRNPVTAAKMMMDCFLKKPSLQFLKEE